MSVAFQLAKYVIHTFQKDLPEKIKEIGIQAIVDQYGLQIASSEFPSSKTLYRAEKTTINPGGIIALHDMVIWFPPCMLHLSM